MSHQKFNLILNSREFITPRVMKFFLTRADGTRFEYTPGQFITLHLPWKGRVLRRSYSIATPAGRVGGAHASDIAVNTVAGGRATDVLFNLRPEACIEAREPFGRFVLRDGPAPRLIVPCRRSSPGVLPNRGVRYGSCAVCITRKNCFSVPISIGSLWSRQLSTLHLRLLAIRKPLLTRMCGSILRA